MDHLEQMEKFFHDLIFKSLYYSSDALIHYNWLRDHGATAVYINKNGFLELRYCGRCSTIVSKGDQFCSQCGRRLTGNG